MSPLNLTKDNNLEISLITSKNNKNKQKLNSLKNTYKSNKFEIKDS
jgi:hypothetical protein